MPNLKPWLIGGGFVIGGYVLLSYLASTATSTTSTTAVVGSTVGSVASNAGDTANTAITASSGLSSDQYAALLAGQSQQSYQLANNANFSGLVDSVYQTLASGVNTQRGFTQDLTASLTNDASGSPSLHISSAVQPTAPQQDLLDKITSLTGANASAQSTIDSLTGQLAAAQGGSTGLQQQVASLTAQLAAANARIASATTQANNAKAATSSQKTPSKGGVMNTYDAILRSLGM